MVLLQLGPGVVPFCPFYFRAPLLKPNSREKGTLIIKGLLRNQVSCQQGLAKKAHGKNCMDCMSAITEFRNADRADLAPEL